MSEILKKLSTYGANVSEAMERFLNDEEMYIDCLRLLAEDKTFYLLGDAVKRRDQKAIFEYAHSLKGAVGNLGITRLFNAICELVEPVRAKDLSNVDELYNNMLEEFETLRECILSYS